MNKSILMRDLALNWNDAQFLILLRLLLLFVNCVSREQLVFRALDV